MAPDALELKCRKQFEAIKQFNDGGGLHQWPLKVLEKKKGNSKAFKMALQRNAFYSE